MLTIDYILSTKSSKQKLKRQRLLQVGTEITTAGQNNTTLQKRK
jgi:hypothetical protein